MPDTVRKTVIRREWENLSNLRDRMLGKRPFPISVPLKPPAGNTAMTDLAYYRLFIDAWRNYPDQSQVRWERRSYRSLKEQMVPCHFMIENFDALVRFVGNIAAEKTTRWQIMMTPLLAIDKSLYPVLVKHLPAIDSLTDMQSRALAELIPQLKPGMGRGLYQRSLPVTGIHTKFIEDMGAFLVDIMDHLYQGDLTRAGGISQWLDCKESPRNWLYVRPLCDSARDRMGGFSNLRLPLDSLMDNPLPAGKILIVENAQSGYALPPLEDTIAVFGGGRNTAWTAASWLADRRVAYWGDIDTDGMTFLRDVRRNIPHVKSLMMDLETLSLFKPFAEQISAPKNRQIPKPLTDDEANLYRKLIASKDFSWRLEQEYCEADYVREHLNGWAYSK